MASYTLSLIQRASIAHDTMLYSCSKPDGFVHIAGQYMDITIPQPMHHDAEGDTRTFSIASAPHEQELLFATRLSVSAFKKSITDMPLPLSLHAEGPNGDFVLHQDAHRPAIFLIGGIGITPVRSIIVDALYRNLPHRLYLFYANRNQQSAPFLDEFDVLAREHETLTFVPTITDSSTEAWSNETGPIDERMIQAYAPQWQEAVYYLAGPATMVHSMRAVLEGMHVDELHIKTEEFSGYEHTEA